MQSPSVQERQPLIPSSIQSESYEYEAASSQNVLVSASEPIGRLAEGLPPAEIVPVQRLAIKAMQRGKETSGLLGKTGFFSSYFGVAALVLTPFFFFVELGANATRIFTNFAWLDVLKEGIKLVTLLMVGSLFFIKFNKYRDYILRQTLSRVKGNTAFREQKNNPVESDVYAYQGNEKYYLSMRRKLFGDIETGFLLIERHLLAIALLTSDEATTFFTEAEKKKEIKKNFICMNERYLELTSKCGRLEGFLARYRSTISATHQDKLDQAVKNTEELSATMGKLHARKQTIDAVKTMLQNRFGADLLDDELARISVLEANERRTNLANLKAGTFFNPLTYRKPHPNSNEVQLDSCKSVHFQIPGP